jgi:NAD(P)-dependent dehydrogenase (short-subunit alcohol dehydrogenase family)
LLKDKVVVIYGAGGAIGGAMARAFADEGAQVFITGHRRATLESVVDVIERAGGTVAAAEVDALDETAIDAHLHSVIEQAGRVDVSINAVGFSNARLVGVPHAELDVERFVAPIADYARSYFLTARLAARQMIPSRSGVIMTMSAIPGRTGTPMNGGYGPAMAAKEAITRDLSVEFAPHGIRVVGIRPHGLPETPMVKGLYDIKAKPSGISWEQFQAYLAGWGHPRRNMRLEEVTAMATFLASDRASGMTGTTVNLTMGGVAD